MARNRCSSMVVEVVELFSLENEKKSLFTLYGKQEE